VQLRWYHSVVTVILQWCYSVDTVDFPAFFGFEVPSGVSVVSQCSQEVLKWCYSGVTVVLQCCYSCITVVLQWYYSGVTVDFPAFFGFEVLVLRVSQCFYSVVPVLLQ
jgi:hypothetical protein